MSSLSRSTSNYSADFEDYEDDFDAYSDSNTSSETKSDVQSRCSSVKPQGHFESIISCIYSHPSCTTRIAKIKSMITLEYVPFEILNLAPMSMYELKLRESLYTPVSREPRCFQQETQTGDALADASVQTNGIEINSVGVQHLEEAASLSILNNKKKKSMVHLNETNPRFQIFIKASSMTCEKLMFERPREVEEILDSKKILSLRHIIPIPADYTLAVIERSPVHPNIIAVAYHFQFESYIHLLHTQWPETPQHVLKCFGHATCLSPFPNKILSHFVFVGTMDGSLFIFDVRLSTSPLFACRPALNDNMGHLAPITAMCLRPPLVSTVDAQGYLIQWHMTQSPLECKSITKKFVEKEVKVVWLDNTDVLYCGEKTLYHCSSNTYRWGLRQAHGRVLAVACRNSHVLLGYDSGFIALFHTQKLGPLAQWYISLERIMHLTWLQDSSIEHMSRCFYFISDRQICRCAFSATYELEILRSESLPENNQRVFLFDRLFLAENRRVLSVYQLM